MQQLTDYKITFRSQMGRGKEPRRTQDEGWNNVPNKAAKIQEKVDPSKLKLSKVF